MDAFFVHDLIKSKVHELNWISSFCLWCDLKLQRITRYADDSQVFAASW